MYYSVIGIFVFVVIRKNVYKFWSVNINYLFYFGNLERMYGLVLEKLCSVNFYFKCVLLGLFLIVVYVFFCIK